MRDLIWVILVRNKAGATPLHGIRPESGGDEITYILHSVGAPRCPPNMQGCTRGCAGSSNDYIDIPLLVPASTEPSDVWRDVLSLVEMATAIDR
jgi:calcium-independent phospholipase A2